MKAANFFLSLSEQSPVTTNIQGTALIGLADGRIDYATPRCAAKYKRHIIEVIGLYLRTPLRRAHTNVSLLPATMTTIIIKLALAALHSQVARRGTCRARINANWVEKNKSSYNGCWQHICDHQPIYYTASTRSIHLVPFFPRCVFYFYFGCIKARCKIQRMLCTCQMPTKNQMLGLTLAYWG